MSKSKDFDPGLNDWLNGTTTQSTSSRVNPSSSATAYATALSKPSPVEGSLISHCEPSGVPPPNHGGNAGLSVPIVSLPDSTSWRLSLAHASSSAPAPVVAASDVAGAASSPSSSEPQPAPRAASPATRRSASVLRIESDSSPAERRGL